MRLFIKAVSLCAVIFSANAFAEKIVIIGEPITLQRQGEMYVVPETYRPTQNYQYVNIDGTKRACFLDRRPDFVNLDVVSINVLIGSQRATWNCYSLDPTYFVIQN
jgi:hypothetical protein